MTNISFDRAASYYDATRALPEPLATRGMDVILDQLQQRPGALLLEVGCGTGRISVPLLLRGANLVGVDLSAKMLARLHAKHPSARVAQADATRLPYGNAQFDGLITVHVLHLIGGWRGVLQEFRRVLRPDAPYVNLWNPHAGNDVDAQLRDYWRSRVQAHGVEWRRPGVQSREQLLEELNSMGARVAEVELGWVSETTTSAQVVENIAGRIFSDTWEVPEPVFSDSVRELRAWAEQTYRDLNAQHIVDRLHVLDVIRL